MPRVVGVRPLGKMQTYDLEVAHPSHQFYLANGLLTSNSHAVSYALDSYMCAYLLTKYEKEWLCAYAEEYATDSKKRARALSEMKAFGYTLARVDVNFAEATWSIMPGKKFMPSFSTIDGVGSAAIGEILANRPYKAVYDLLWNDDGTWRHSKFNKKVLENLIKVGAFDSMDMVGEGKYFESYKHMHECLIQNWARLKKRDGRQLIDGIRDATRCEDWSRDEKVSMYVELVGELDTALVIPPDKMARLYEKGVESIDSLEEGDKAICWLVIVEMRPSKTKKGKPYLKLSAVGESGQQHNIFLWGWKPDEHAVQGYCGYLAEVERTEFGMSTTPWKMRLIE